MENKLSNPNQTVFEQIKRLDENKNEYWTARDLCKVLEYSEYRHFKPVIDKAREACRNSGQQINDHFEDYLEEIIHGKGAKQNYESVKLSRYAVVDHFEDVLDMVPIGSGAVRKVGGDYFVALISFSIRLLSERHIFRKLDKYCFRLDKA